MRKSNRTKIKGGQEFENDLEVEQQKKTYKISDELWLILKNKLKKPLSTSAFRQWKLIGLMMKGAPRDFTVHISHVDNL